MRKSFLVPTLSVFIVGIVLGIADPSVWIDPSLRTNTIGPTIVRVSLSTTGAITAGSFVGDGSLLTGVAGGGGLSSSDPGVFSTNNSKLYVKSGAGLTNTHFAGSDVTFPVGQRFDTVVVTNALGIRDSDGVSTYQLNNVSGDFLLSGPGTTLMTYTQSVGRVYFKNPIQGESTVSAAQVIGNIKSTNSTASRAAIVGADNIVSNSTVTATELAFLSGQTYTTISGFVNGSNNVAGLRTPYVVTSNDVVNLKALLQIFLPGANLTFTTNNGTNVTAALSSTVSNVIITNSSGITSTGTVAGVTFIGSTINLTNSASPGSVAIQTTNGNPIVISGAPQALSYTGSGAAGTNVSVSATNGHFFTLRLTNNVFLTAANMAVGQELGIVLIQGGIGDYKLSFNTNTIRTNTVDGYTLVTNVGGQTFVSIVPGYYGTNAAAGVRKMF